jgi:serine/threonine protein phosphatase PrpC
MQQRQGAAPQMSPAAQRALAAQRLFHAQQQPSPGQYGNAFQTFLRSLFLFILTLPILFIVGRQFGLAALLVATFVVYKLGCLQLITLGFRWLFVSDASAYKDALRRADTMVQPITSKESEFKENHLLSFGYSAMQGWRRSMEDAHTAILEPYGGFFAVFDGHSGSTVAQFCGQNLHRFITKTAAFEVKSFTKAMYDGFMNIDKHLHKNQPRDRSGCTAVSLLIHGDDLVCANAGDSRCVLCRDGEAIPLSNDHKPYTPTEQMRIERAGGYVWNRRVNGILALSRAIGDFMFKTNPQIAWEDQAVTASPEVKTIKLDRARDEFVILACDGIWDVLTNEQVIEFVRPLLMKGVPPVEVCDKLMHQCLSPHPFGLGCDNMSVVIITFKKQPFPTPLSQHVSNSASVATVANSSSNSSFRDGQTSAAASTSDEKED